METRQRGYARGTVERQDVRGHYDGEDVPEGRVRLPYEELDAMWPKESVHHVTGRAEPVIRLDQPDPAEYYR
ncbi:hypothetical protein ACIRFH_01995 [Streptomyces sp. NPDC093586]|uniref:hypothetical protein n=1 Tax=Streptomyces sp. NPDC093586 TaxID=3366042 RepID=UPI00380FD3EF